MADQIVINLQNLLYVVPWVGAGDIASEEEWNSLSRATTDNDYQLLIKRDVLPEFQNLDIEKKQGAKLAMQALLSATCSDLFTKQPHIWLGPLERYKDFSWTRFWQRLLIPFDKDEITARRIMVLIWEALFGEEDYYLDCSDRVVITQDI